jgi:membrane-bound inhibitor of C-type lysozyme
MWHWRAAAVAILTVSLAACGGPEPKPIKVRKMEDTVRYECEGGRSMEAQFRAGEAAVTLLVGGQSLILPQVPAAAGVAYSDGAVTLHLLEGTASTEGLPGGDYTGCQGG